MFNESPTLSSQVSEVGLFGDASEWCLLVYKLHEY